MTQRIGIFGGTFDPVHLGHLAAAQDALEGFELDRIWLLPCRVPPHKPGGAIATPEQRIAMLEDAVEGDTLLEVCRIEMEREGPSYTVETLRELHRRFPGTRWCWIIGSDTLTELHSWKQIGEILSLCDVVTLGRPGFDPERLRPEDLKLDDLRRAHALLDRVLPGRQIGISSTEIRMRVAEGLRIRYLVPDSVDMFISEHGLYRE